MREFTIQLLMSVMTAASMAAPALDQRDALTLKTTQEEAMLSRIAERSLDQSRTREDAHQLLDVIGPRLTASPADLAAHDWIQQAYKRMGLESWNESYGSRPRWRRGVTHVDLVYPRVRTLDASALAWSPGTKGTIKARTMILPHLGGPAEFKRWLLLVRGAYILASLPDSSCRPIEDWKAFSTPEVMASMDAARAKAYADWIAVFDKIGVSPREFPRAVEAAGAAGVLVRDWWKDSDGKFDPNPFGNHPVSRPASVSVIMDGDSRGIPMINLGCEDYGLLWRLTQSGDHPRINATVDAVFLKDSPIEETLAKIPGTEFPDQVVVLSAHLDSWDGGSGATDNGTGTLRMLEAMRILRELYPKPRRTIIARHWSGEEQGLHPPPVPGAQLLLNQDVGTGRATALFVRGVPAIKGLLEKMLDRLPPQVRADLEIDGPDLTNHDTQGVCSGAAEVNLWPSQKIKDSWAETWSYNLTWHTDRDTYDKIVFDDVQADITLLAMLAYLASEDPDAFPDTHPAVTNPWSGQVVDMPPCLSKLR